MISQETARYQAGGDRTAEARVIMSKVMAALREKGYNPIHQVLGYFLSGDPTYITNYEGARSVIREMDRDELLECILTYYINSLQ